MSQYGMASVEPEHIHYGRGYEATAACLDKVTYLGIIAGWIWSHMYTPHKH
jgi:hypothetical protein